MANQLKLAVAGSRKTQGIVEYCAQAPADRNILVLTYTQANQLELQERIFRYAGDRQRIQTMGWFTFLLRDFARPFLPFKLPGKRVKGFNFDGRPHRMATGEKRFLDSEDSVYACELGRLANELISESKGALIHRLECIYDEILIDEIQDLSSHDWRIVDVLFDTSIDIRMVGDIRQSVLSTNPRSSKNKRYKYAEVINWFRDRENDGVLEIIESNITWRCHTGIAEFSDTIFSAEWDFPKTDSKNNNTTGHDGVFIVREKHAEEYVKKFKPQCLRNSASSGKKYNFNFMNFKVSKGQTFERVFIVPTKGITDFLKANVLLEPTPAASFYVAVTRARQSVAILVPNKGDFGLPVWEPYIYS